MIRAQVFDIGNVVCAFRPDRRLDALARATGLTIARIQEAVWSSGLDFRADAGELSPTEVERAIVDALDRRIDVATLRSAWSTAFVPDSEVCDIVKALDRPSYAFTNNGPMLTACFEHELTEVRRLFERVIYSWQVRSCKPSRAAFEGLCTELNRQPHELLFIDDTRENVESARALGLAAIEFNSSRDLRSDLRELGVLN